MLSVKCQNGRGGLKLENIHFSFVKETNKKKGIRQDLQNEESKKKQDFSYTRL